MGSRRDSVPVVGVVPRYSFAQLRAMDANGRLTLGMGRRMAMTQVDNFWTSFGNIVEKFTIAKYSTYGLTVLSIFCAWGRRICVHIQMLCATTIE